MVTDPAVDLLALWERGAALPPIERSLALAEAAGRPRADLLQSPVGATHRAMLDLRRHLLGEALDATAWCPSCGERVEFVVGIDQFREGDGAVSGEAGPVRWRAPTPGDLLAVADQPDPLAALRARCLDGGEPSEALEELLAQADPLAETLLDLDCPACGEGFFADLDIGAFVWQEVAAAARRLLLQIDTLARTYGWTQDEILALPPVRREAYLRMAAGRLP